MSLELLYIIIGIPGILLGVPLMDCYANDKSFKENFKAAYTFKFRKDK